MIRGDFSGYSSLGLGSAYTPKPLATERAALTLDAKLDPKAPHQYSVSVARDLIQPPERTSDAKSNERKPYQNNDPVSRVFLSIADYQPTRHRIDIDV